MPLLVVEQFGKRKAGLLPRRLIIGRLPTLHLFINDTGVSRVHAYIDQRDGSAIITDCGSLTGTEVNGQLIAEPTPLADGDRIRVGAAKLLFRDGDHVPADAREISFDPKGQDLPPTKVGILFDCTCGAPAWARFTDAGKAHQCRHCGQQVIIPSIPWGRARPAPPGMNGGETVAIDTGEEVESFENETAAIPLTDGATKCSICQQLIGSEDRLTQCPECKLSFHSECWQENFGCSSYGCSQVNVLKPPDPDADRKAVAEDAERFPWEYMLLAATVVAVLIGAFTFGIPPALAALVALGCVLARKLPHRGILAATIALGVLGALAGVLASYFWYFDVALWSKYL